MYMYNHSNVVNKENQTTSNCLSDTKYPKSMVLEKMDLNQKNCLTKRLVFVVQNAPNFDQMHGVLAATLLFLIT